MVICVVAVVDSDMQGLVLSGCFHILPSGETPEDFLDKASAAARVHSALNNSTAESPPASLQ